MASTLIIGIGTTGLRIIEEAQQYHYEFTGRNKPGSNIEYLYIETDTSRLPKSTAGGETEIEAVMFDFEKIQVDIDQLKKDKKIDSAWVPDASYLEQSHKGAGGMPSFGRLSLWKTKNYLSIRERIEAKFHSIKGNKESDILVVGSLTGGTGSGLCVDIAYLIQDVLPNNVKNLNALFLIPDRASTNEDMALHENAFSAMSAISHYNNPKNKFSTVWPDKKAFSSTAPPFQLCHYLSQDFSNSAASIKDLGELVKVAGMHVLLNIINTNKPGNYFRDSINRRQIDQHGAERLENNLSSGFMMIQYPKAQLKELLALKISSEHVQSIIDSEQYITVTGTKKFINASTPNFESVACKDFENILENCLSIFDNITNSDGIVISDDIELKIQKITENNLPSSDKRELHKLFNTTQTDGYFKLFASSLVSFRNKLIDELHDYAQEITEKHKNLHITRIYFNRINLYIDELIAFYSENYSLDGKEDTWDSHLGIMIDKLYENKFQYDIIFQKKKFYSYILNEAKESLKINCIIPELKKLKDTLNQERITSSVNGKTLPSLEYINTLIKKLNFLANGDDLQEMTLKRRSSELSGSLDRYSTCFKMLYLYDSKEEDISNAHSKYIKSDSRLNINTLFSGNIWDFVINDNFTMYRTAIKNSVEFINQKALFDSNLIEIINKLDPTSSLDNQEIKGLFNSSKVQIKDNLPALIGISNNYELGNDDKSKLHIITSDHNMYNKLFTKYKVDPSEDNTTDLTDLKDVIVYYQEYATTTNADDSLFKPLSHINTMEDTKRHISDVLKRDDKNDTEKYVKKKSPYFDRKTLNQLIS